MIFQMVFYPIESSSSSATMNSMSGISQGPIRTTVVFRSFQHAFEFRLHSLSYVWPSRQIKECSAFQINVVKSCRSAV